MDEGEKIASTEYGRKKSPGTRSKVQRKERNKLPSFPTNHIQYEKPRGRGMKSKVKGRKKVKQTKKSRTFKFKRG